MFVANDTGYFYWQTVQNATRRESHHESAKEFENLWPEGEFLMLCFNGTPCRDWVLPCDKGAESSSFVGKRHGTRAASLVGRSCLARSVESLSCSFLSQIFAYQNGLWSAESLKLTLTNNKYVWEHLHAFIGPLRNNIAFPLKLEQLVSSRTVIVWVRPLLGLALFILADLRRSPL